MIEIKDNTVEIKDNREEIKRTKDAKSEACRVCGSKVVHSKQYNYPTMSCIVYLRGEIDKLKAEIGWIKFPEGMGK